MKLSDETLQKQKERLRKIKHQQGQTNSQYGTMWIHNLDLRQNSKINKGDPIPNGWQAGRIVDFDSYFGKQQKKEDNKKILKQKRLEIRKEKVKLYTEWYEIYKTVDFKEFCSRTGYNKSQQNLCSKFKEFVESYDPKAKNGYSA